MSEYKSKYRELYNAGSTIGDSQFNATANFIESTFADSPSYHIVMWNGVGLEVRITDPTSTTHNTQVQPIQFGIKYAQFKPNVVMDIGEVLDLDGVYWMITDFTSENKLFPKAKIEMCNSTYPIKANKTSVLMGYDQNGKPQKKDVYSVDTMVPCIVEIGNNSNNMNAQLVVPKNALFITVQYQTSDTFAENYKFTMYGNNYQIVESDQTKVIGEKGIIRIIAERV